MAVRGAAGRWFPAGVPSCRGPARQPGDRNRPKLLGRLSSSEEIRIHPRSRRPCGGLRRRGRRAPGRTASRCPQGAGGQARALGEEKGEGTSGFVEPGPYGPGEITVGHATPFSCTRPAGQQQKESPTSGAAANGRGAPRRMKPEGSRPTALREDQLVNEGGNTPGRDGVPVTQDLAPPGEKTTFANSSGRPLVPNRPLAFRGPFLHTLRALIGPVFVKKCSCPNLRSQRGKFWVGGPEQKAGPRAIL